MATTTAPHFSSTHFDTNIHSNSPPSPPLQKLRSALNQTHSYLQTQWKWCVETYHDHSDMVSQVTYFSLNTIIFASKIFEQIPYIIHRGCYTALSFTSVMYMNMQLRDLFKNCKDLNEAFKAKDKEGMLVTAAKVTTKSLNILLTGGLLAAALFSLFAFPEITLCMYAVMRPFSLFSLIVGIGSDIYDYNKSTPLIRSFEKLNENSKNHRQALKADQVMRHFLKRLYNEEDSDLESEEKRLARHTFRQLDHYVIETMYKKLQKKHPEKTADQVIKALTEQDAVKLCNKLKEALELKQNYKQAHLGLTVLGYLSMFICKIWPDTLVQSGVTWAISSLYTAKLIWKKYKHSKWSDSLPLNPEAA